MIVGLPLGEKPDTPGLRIVMGSDTTCKDSDGRHYAVMTERLTLGMSGAPVLGTQGQCRGVFQGILGSPEESELDPGLVPLKQDWDRCAGYISSNHLHEFVSNLGTEDSREARRGSLVG